MSSVPHQVFVIRGETSIWGMLAAAGLAGLALGGILAGAWFHLHQPKLRADVVRFEIAAPPRASFSVSSNAASVAGDRFFLSYRMGARSLLSPNKTEYRSFGSAR